MGRIHKLDDQLTNMIAAGEVVERPMGVVKELVENSIDAGATDIEVRMEDGGLKQITVMDNGCGMSAEDAVAALQRHATSKIARVDDLWNIQTMGFRGEALPSIASVSKFDMRTNDGHESTRICVEYGKPTYAGPKAAPEGTLIQVEGLLRNTPARLKHISNLQTEGKAITDLMEKFAFGRPDIAFRLYSNDILRLETKGNGDLQEVLFRVYDSRIAEAAVPVDFQDYDFHVKGILVMPQFTRSTKNYIYTYFNDRITRSYREVNALLNAYEPYHEPTRYPIAILKIYADAHLLDVNVHPSKWEIRISKEDQLDRLIEANVRKTLQEKFRLWEMPGLSKRNFNSANTKDDQLPTYKREKNVQQSFDHLLYKDTPSEEAADETINTVKEPERPTAALTDESPKEETVREEYRNVSLVNQEDKHESDTWLVEGEKLPPLRVIGQFHSDYILAEGDDGLYIIDQHAAQERMNFERFSHMVNKKPYTMQGLLVPIIIRLSAVQMAMFPQLQSYLSEIGIHMEKQEENNVIIKEIPVWMTRINHEEAIHDLIDSYDPDHMPKRSVLQKHMVATLACHSSIRFNRNLTMDEMKKVIQDLNACAQPYNCPHGRPTVIKLKDKDLRKEFERG